MQQLSEATAQHCWPVLRGCASIRHQAWLHSWPGCKSACPEAPSENVVVGIVSSHARTLQLIPTDWALICRGLPCSVRSGFPGLRQHQRALHAQHLPVLRHQDGRQRAAHAVRLPGRAAAQAHLRVCHPAGWAHTHPHRLQVGPGAHHYKGGNLLFLILLYFLPLLLEVICCEYSAPGSDGS